MTTGPAETALIIAVPEAEPLVSTLRSLHDPSASAGVPTHITILYPFVSAEALDEGVIDGVRGVLSRYEAFTFSLRAVERFEEGLVYLTPSPAELFLALTEAFVERFPEHPPYGGEIDVIVPHLTLATEGPPEIEGQLRARLPIDAIASEVLLIVQDEDGMWSVRERLPLGAGG